MLSSGLGHWWLILAVGPVFLFMSCRQLYGGCSRCRMCRPSRSVDPPPSQKSVVLPTSGGGFGAMDRLARTIQAAQRSTAVERVKTATSSRQLVLQFTWLDEDHHVG
ncbi:MAG: hypothetical protein WC480_04705 [Patescibacteria group bacterium]